MSARLLHAVQISFFNDTAQRTPGELLEAWSTLVDVAEAVARSGVRVSVVHACAYVRQLDAHGVRHRESTGYSLIEALACGLPPVVTDILPSFRALTAGGAVGALWPCGDAQTLSLALQSVAARTDAATRAAVRAHFERELSFESLGSKLAAMYAQAIERHGTPLARCAPQDA
jgi:hypothetical protein